MMSEEDAESLRIENEQLLEALSASRREARIWRITVETLILRHVSDLAGARVVQIAAEKRLIELAPTPDSP